MAKSSLQRAVRRQIRLIYDALPPLPHFPRLADIARWWRSQRRSPYLPPLPRLRSPREMWVAWKRFWKNPYRPSLPPPPSPSDIIESIKHAPGLEGGLPAPPSPKDFKEWIQEDPKVRKRFLRNATVFLILLIIAYFAGPPAWRAGKALYVRRLAAQAMVMIDQKQWSIALTKLNRAYDLRPADPDVWHANARLFSRTRQGLAAVQWWEKYTTVRPLTIEDHRDFAAAALNANELALADLQIGKLMRPPEAPTPADMLLIGQLAALRGHNAAALAQANKVLGNAETSSQERLGANLLILTSSAQGSTDYAATASRIVELARDPHDESSLEALTILARQIVANPPAGNTSTALAITPPIVPATEVSAKEIADRIEAHEQAKPFHRILALELRGHAESLAEDRLVTEAVRLYGKGDDRTLAALGAWLYTRGRFQTMVDLLPIKKAELNRELLIERIDALAALGRFAEARKMLLTEYPVLTRTFQHMYLAVIRNRLGEVSASENEWHRALDTAERVQHFISLAEYALRFKKLEIADEAYRRATVKEPSLRSAYVARLRLLEINGPADAAHKVAAQIIAQWPDDSATRLHEMYLRVLLDPSPEHAAALEKELEPVVGSSPWQGLARSTLALARLRQNQPGAALEALTSGPGGAPPENTSWPVYVAALAANGWHDKAREQAGQLAAVKLLPEERALMSGVVNRGD